MRSTLVLCVTLGVLSPVSRAQERIWYADGTKDMEGFGTAFDFVQDLDADGLKELLIGVPGRYCSSTNLPDGVADLFSIPGGQLNEWCGEEELLGNTVTALGDVDLDGVDDLMLGAPSYDDPSLGSDSGRVFVISARTGAQLLEVRGNDPGIAFGNAIAGLPDYDGDGYPEMLVAACGYSSARGEVYVLSTKDGSTLRRYEGAADGFRYGSNVAALGDVDADGVSDYAIQAWLNFFGGGQKGRVYVYSGATGALLWKVTGIANSDRLGTSIADGGDIDGDGHADVLCGGEIGLSTNGHLDAYSGTTGALLLRIEGDQVGERFGYSCDMVGDANGDGVGDYLAGAIANKHDGNNAGRATLFSGKTLRPIYTFYPGYNGAGFGWKVRGGFDFNHDGINDFVISAPYSRNYPPKGGRVSIFAGNDLYLQADESNPLPGDFVTFDTRGGAPGSFAELVLVDINGTLMFAPLDYGFLDANGELASTLCVPDDASGLEFTLISYAVKLTHRPKWNDSSPVVISVQ